MALKLLLCFYVLLAALGGFGDAKYIKQASYKTYWNPNSPPTEWDSTFPTTLNLTSSDNSIHGRIAYDFSEYTVAIQVNGTLVANIIQLNIFETNDFCNPDNLNVTFTADEFGRQYNDSILLFRSTTACAPNNRTRNLYAAGIKPRLVLGYDVGNNNQFPTHTISLVADPVPVLTILQSQAFVMIDKIVQGINVTAHIKGAGIPSREMLQTLQAIALAPSPFPDSSIPLPEFSTALDFNSNLCFYRPQGIWCEDGQLIWLKQHSVEPVLPEPMMNFTSLRYLNLIVKNTFLTLPTTTTRFCDLVHLSEFLVSNTVKLPLCWITMPKLQLVRMVGAKFFPTEVTQMRGIQVFEILGNGIVLSNIPRDFSNMTSLESISVQLILPVDSGVLSAEELRFNNMPHLKCVNFPSAKLNATLIATSFDNNPELEYVNFDDNRITGVIPHFLGSHNTQYVSFSRNQISGPFPENWQNLELLNEIHISHALLTTPFQLGRFLPALDIVELSWNQIYYDDDSSNFRGTVLGPVQLDGLPSLNMLLQDTGRFASRIDYSHNDIGGDLIGLLFDEGQLEYLQYLDLSYNRVRSISCDVIKLGNFIEFNMGNNNISYLTFPLRSYYGCSEFSSTLRVLNFTSNPYLIAGKNVFGRGLVLGLPDGMLFDNSSATFITGNSYDCNLVYTPKVPLLEIFVSPTFYNYVGCTCIWGQYGVPPVCQTIPSLVNLTRSTQIITNPSVSSLENYLITQQAHITMSTLLSDDDFGSRRFVSGMDSVFTITTPNSSCVVTNVLLFVNRLTFNAETDIIRIVQGDSGATDGSSDEIFLLFGTNTQALNTGSSLVTQLYGSAGATKIYANNTALFIIQSFLPDTSILYSSKQTFGSLFALDWTFSTSCPSNYFNNSLGYCQIILPCALTDYEPVLSSCSDGASTQTIRWELNSGVICNQTQIPNDIVQSCNDVPARASVTAILIALASLLALLALFRPTYELFRYFTLKHPKCCFCFQWCRNSDDDEDENADDSNSLRIRRRMKNALHGLWSAFIQMSWVLQIVAVVYNYGPVDEVKCNLRIYAVILGFFLAQGSLYTSAKLIAENLSHKVLDLKRFEIQSTLFLSLGVIIGVSCLIVMTNLQSGSFLHPIYQTLDSQITLQNGYVCSLGSVFPFAATLFSLDLVLALVNLVQLLPNWLTIHNQLKTKAKGLKRTMEYYKRTQQWWQLFALATITFVNITTNVLVVLLTYTDAAGIINDNVAITNVQMSLFLVNVGVSFIVYYLLPYLGAKTISETDKKRQNNGTTNNYNSKKLKGVEDLVYVSAKVGEEEIHPLTTVLNEPYLSYQYVKFLSNNKRKNGDFIQYVDIITQIMNLMKDLSNNELQDIIVNNNINNNNNTDVDEKTLAMNKANNISVIGGELAAIINQKLGILVKLGIKDSTLIHILESLNMNTLTTKETKKLLYPVISTMYYELEQQTWDEFAQSSELREGNDIMQWQSLYRTKSKTEREYILASFEQQV